MSTYSKRSSAGRFSPVKSALARCNSTGVTPDSSHITSSSFASYSSSSSSSAAFFDQRRSVSPSRVSLHALAAPPSTRSVRFSVDSSAYPRRSIAVAAAPRKQVLQNGNAQKKSCMCSPTTHPGSFRCALHKNSSSKSRNHSISYSPNRLNMRRSAMTNSLVRIGTVEGDLVRRALASLIRPSSHQQRRRGEFRPRSSRLSAMSNGDDF